VSRDALTGAPRFTVNMGVDGVITLAGGGLIAGVWWESWDSAGYGIWSSKDGTLIQKFPLIPGHLSGSSNEGQPPLACWRDGDLCAVCTSNPDGLKVTIWRTDGTIVRTLAWPSGANINDIAFSPDGSLIALAGDKARVYRISDGELVGERTFRYGVF